MQRANKGIRGGLKILTALECDYHLQVPDLIQIECNPRLCSLISQRHSYFTSVHVKTS